VKHACRIVLLALLFVALPMRGYAGVMMSLCEAQHGGAATTHEHVHDHGDSHHDDTGAGGGNSTHAASMCSVCASCCAGAGLAPDSPRVAEFQSPGSDRIGFFDRRPSGFVPEHLDRPPLAS
jgi:hypothetical protein